MNVYILNGKKAIVHEGELFVQAESYPVDGADRPLDAIGVAIQIRNSARERINKLNPAKKSAGKVETVGRSDKSKRLDQETKEALIEELAAGNKSITELAKDYGMTVSGVHYIRKKAGIDNIQPGGRKPKDSDEDEAEDTDDFVKKNFRCDCGKGFSARTTGKPGETVTCPDEDCGAEILASEGEEI